MDSPVTLQSVASRAGVSPATASRALNGGNLVRPGTREKVLAAARELEYRPNITARILSGGSSDTVCLIVPGFYRQTLSRFYYASLIAGVEDTAYHHDLHVIIKSKNEIDSTFRLLEQHRIGGVLLRVGHNQTLETKYIRRLRQMKIPFVIIGKPPQGTHETSIHVDIIGGARALAHHYASQGFKRILYVSGPKRNSDSNDRYYGFRLGLTEKGYDESLLVVAPGDYTPESGYRAASEYLPHGKFDAVFASTDHAALGVLTYCASRRIRVPDQIAVGGYDDQDYAAYTWPSLTTVRQPVHELGQHAIEQLLHCMQSDKRKDNAMILSPTLVIRQSTRRGGSVPVLPEMSGDR